MIQNLITRKLISARTGTPISEICNLMASNNVGSIVIMDEDTPAGIITDRDIVVRCVAKGLDIKSTLVEEVMSSPAATCKDTEGVFHCIQKMNELKVRRVIVIDSSQKALGVISFGDITAMLAREFYELTRHTTSAEDWVKDTLKRKVA